MKKLYCEICGTCNLRCSFCPITDQPRGLMSFDLFESIVQQIRSWKCRLYLHVLGEPLLHPEFRRFVACAREHEVPVSLVTNGFLLQDYEDLYQVDLGEISISLQSFEGNFSDRREFEAYLQQILEWVKRYRANGGKGRINLRLWNQTSGCSQNWCERQDIQLICRWFGIAPETLTIKETIFPQALKLASYTFLVLAPYFIWPSLEADEVGEKGYCHGGIDQLAILADGRVVPCCLDHAGVIELGNVHRQSLDEIIKSPRYVHLTEGFKCGERRELLCQHCDFSKRFGGK